MAHTLLEKGNHLMEESFISEDNPLIYHSKFYNSERHLTHRSKLKRQRNRLIQKHGLCNISLVNVPMQHRGYFRDIFNTILEIKWRWCIFFFCISFALSWLFFAIIYSIISIYHGDFEHTEENWKPCVQNGNSFLNIFLFSFTSQTTIGYGYRYPTDACPIIILIMMVQFKLGVICQALMTGVIFAKLARPIKRAATIIFSKNAVICMRNGKLCLLFRVGDMRKSSLAEAHVRLQMIKKHITDEGEILPFHQYDMNVGYDMGLDRVVVMWPITICHVIDETSPLYEMTKEDLENSQFEIIAILEGVVESVGSTTQARTSYLPNEVLWGKRFDKLVTYQKDNGAYQIDFGKFHNTIHVNTPTCSAKDIDESEENHSEENIYNPQSFAPYITIEDVPHDDATLSPLSGSDSKLESTFQIEEDFLDENYKYVPNKNSPRKFSLSARSSVCYPMTHKLSVRSNRFSMRAPSQLSLNKRAGSVHLGHDIF
uniref:Inward rectifier potassium channel irk-1 n=1 Tax=Parastrongyloides trichosuri TaxID=131310 RepID=A0A0N5A5X4_PARTI